MSELSANVVAQEGGDVSRPARVNGSGSGRRIGPQGRILLLDTDVPFRQTLVAALERFGIEVSWRARVLGLFDALAEADPISLVMSADLPGSDPLELIRSVRRSRWAELPILIVANEPDRSFELRAYVDGADTVVARAGAAGELAAHIMGHAARRIRRRRDAARDLADVALAISERDAPTAQPDAAVDERYAALGEPGGAALGERGGAAPGTPVPPAFSAPDPAGAVVGHAQAAPPNGHVHDPRGSAASGYGSVEHQAADSTPLAQLLHDPTAASPFGTTAMRSGGVAGPIDGTPASHAAPGTPAAPLLHPQAAVPDVILVDDDPSLLEMLRYALTNRGYKTPA